MTTLVSILNSGESLEKAVVLMSSAVKLNFEFYSRYDKIVSIYFENLPRTNKTTVHGTFGGLIQNFKNEKFIPYNSIDDLWDDREKILEKLVSNGRISKRMEIKLQNDKIRFDRTILHIPWYFTLDKFKSYLENSLMNDHKMELKFFDFKKISLNMFNCPPDNLDCKLFLLHPDGFVGSRLIRKWKKNNSVKQLRPVERSIVVSPNVLTFLTAINQYCSTLDKFEIGYRPFIRTKRESYDRGIKFLRQNNFLVEEPRNTAFNTVLDEIDREYRNICQDRKITLGVYNILNQIV